MRMSEDTPVSRSLATSERATGRAADASMATTDRGNAPAPRSVDLRAPTANMRASRRMAGRFARR